MKITKARLKEIIKEEIEEAMFVDASTQRYAGPQYTPKPIDPFADETVPSMRKTQVEDPDEPSSKVAGVLELLIAQLSPAERKELARQLASK